MTDINIREEAIKYGRKFWEELDRQKMLDLFEKENKDED